MWEDISTVCVIEEKPASVDFKCYEIAGYEADSKGEYTKVLYLEDKSKTCDMTEDIEKAENYFRGFIKWDACSHVYFGDPENSGYIHICGGDNWRNLQEALRRVYDEAGKLLIQDHSKDMW